MIASYLCVDIPLGGLLSQEGTKNLTFELYHSTIYATKPSPLCRAALQKTITVRKISDKAKWDGGHFSVYFLTVATMKSWQDYLEPLLKSK